MTSTMPTTVCHITGPAVQFNGRTVQRCCWCGAKILDSGTSGGEIRTWQPGMLVRISEEGAHEGLGFLSSVKSFPNDLCIPLVEEIG